MNPWFVFIASWILQGIGWLIYMAWKKGREEEKLAVIEKREEEREEERLAAIKDLKKQIGDLETKNVFIETELANVRGWLRGVWGSGINGH